MQWWGWLIIGVLVALVIVLTVLLLREKTVGLTTKEKEELSNLQAEKFKGELQFEKDKTESLKAAFAEQRQKLSKLKEWYEGEKQLIKKASQDEVQEYLDDVDAAGAEFDRIIGTCSEGIKSPDS